MCWEKPIRSVGPQGNHDRESHSVGWRLTPLRPRLYAVAAFAAKRDARDSWNATYCVRWRPYPTPKATL